MDAPNFRRTVDELDSKASKYWPKELSERASEKSVIPLLLKSQDQFCAILTVKLTNLKDFFHLVTAAELSANLFVKHLAVLADFGGEPLQRLNREFNTLFPSGKLEYLTEGETHSYTFKSLPIKQNLNNQRLGIDGKGLLDDKPFSDTLQDVTMILLYGSACVDEYVAEKLVQCEIGNYIGKHEELEKFVRQRYIWVSRITQGATSNDLGHLAQDAVYDYLKDNVQIPGSKVEKDGSIPEIYDRGRTQIQFDVVISKPESNKYVAVEVMFQVTTNSVIERKRGQAQPRFRQLEDKGYKIAYVIDGAGSFQRRSALTTLLSYSHCQVAFSDEEFSVLNRFIQEYFKD